MGRLRAEGGVTRIEQPSEDVPSKTRINKAGATICAWWRDFDSVDDAKCDDAIATMLWFRAQHQLPLANVTRALRRAVRSHGHDTTRVAQRMKRARSVMVKLGRSNSTRLTTMNDIAGCRVVLPSLADVHALTATIQERRGDLIRDFSDTTLEPTPSGYRGVHIVVEQNTRRVEIQLRTDIQDRWASIVERLDRDLARVGGMDLKHGVGPEPMLAFLKALSVSDLEAERDGAISAVTRELVEGARQNAIRWVNEGT
jgi:hypothetical protein